MMMALILAVPVVDAQGQYYYDEPTVTTFISGDNTIESGETETFNVQVRNEGDRSINSYYNTTGLQSVSSIYGFRPGQISSVRVEFDDDQSYEHDADDFDVKSEYIGLNSISSGSNSGSNVRIEASEGISAGEYEIPVEVEYTYTDRVSTGGGHSIGKDTDTEYDTIHISVGKSGNIEISESSGTSLYKNSEGQVEIELKNSGNENANDVSIEMVESQNIKPTTNMVSLGSLDSGEKSKASFQATVSDINSPGEYSVGFKMRYEGNNGNVKRTDTEYTTVTVKEGPDYEVDVTESELYVDSIGRVEVNIENTGDHKMEDASLDLKPVVPFSPISSSGWIGSLDPGENATSEFKIDVSNRAIAQSYPLEFVVEHVGKNDNKIRSESIITEVEVGDEKSFEITESDNISVGSTEIVEYEIKNTGDSTMEDATIRINSNTPFETDDDTSFVGDIDQGEVKNVRYKISVGGAATSNKTYALDTTIKYKNEYGETVTTDTNPAPITVTEDDSLPVIPIIAILGIVIGLGTAFVLYKSEKYEY